MTHDRVPGDEFELTQEFLAQALQDAGCLSYKRGRITILDRAGLEREACPCYRIIRGEFDRLLTEPIE